MIVDVTVIFTLNDRKDQIECDFAQKFDLAINKKYLDMTPNEPVGHSTTQKLKDILNTNLDGLLLRPTPAQAMCRLHTDNFLGKRSSEKVQTIIPDHCLVTIWYGGIDKSAEYRFLCKRNQGNNFLEPTELEKFLLLNAKQKTLQHVEQSKDISGRFIAGMLDIFVGKYGVDQDKIDLIPVMEPERDKPKVLIVINSDGHAYQLTGSSSLSSFIFLGGRLFHAACCTFKFKEETLGIISTPDRKRIIFYLKSSNNPVPTLLHKQKNFEKALSVVLAGKVPVAQFISPTKITQKILSALERNLNEGQEKSDLADSIFDTIVSPKKMNWPRPSLWATCGLTCYSLCSLWHFQKTSKPLAHNELDHESNTNNEPLAL